MDDRFWHVPVPLMIELGEVVSFDDLGPVFMTTQGSFHTALHIDRFHRSIGLYR